MEDGENSVAGSSQHTYLAESSAKMSAERRRRLSTLRKRKQRSQSTIVAKRVKGEQERVQEKKACITVVLYCSLGSH